MKEEHDKIMNVVTPYLVRVHHVPYTSSIIKQFSQQLETCLNERCMAPLSYLDVNRARRELDVVKSIRYKLNKEKLILRVTDKSGIFHIGHSDDYERKVKAYQERTKAYIELPENPLWTVFDKVVRLLNDLRSKNHIKVWQLNKMMPKRDKVELAHLYFIPKPHKVNLEYFLFSLLSIKLTLMLFILKGWDTIETHNLIDEYTNYWYFEIS